MAEIKLHYVKLREQPDGSARPRFSPGPRERSAGFTDLDLKHPDGRWFTRDEAYVWSQQNYQTILDQRRSGKRIKAPPVVKGTTVEDLLLDFQRSERFKLERAQGGYSDESKADYRYKIEAIRFQPQSDADRKAGQAREPELFAQKPVSAIGKPEAKMFYEHLAKVRGQVMATRCMMVLSAAFEFGSLSDRWRLKFNPCHRLKLPTPDARIRIASDIEIRTLMAAGDHADVGLPEAGDAVFLGLFTGQRQADVLNLVPSEGEPGRTRLKQSKTGAIVSIPETPQLTARMAQASARRARMHNTIVDTTIVIHAATGRRFNKSTFRHCFSDVRRAAVEGIVDQAATAAAAANGRNETVWSVEPCPSLADFHYQDLRDTAVTWYARAECTVPEIAAITGHSLRSIYSILKHYLALDEHLADSAVRKLVAWMEKAGVAV